MEHNRHVFHRSCAILARKKVTSNHFDSNPTAVESGQLLKPSYLAGRPAQAAEVAKSTIQQILHKSRPDEPGRPSYEDGIVLANYEISLFCLVHISHLVDDVRFLYWIEAQER